MDSKTQQEYQRQYYQAKKAAMSAEELEEFRERKADIQRRYAHSEAGQKTFELWRQQETVRKRHADAERRRRGTDRYRETLASEKAKRDEERATGLRYRQEWLQTPAGQDYLARQRERERQRGRERSRKCNAKPESKMKARGRRLLRLYGITLNDYLSLYEAQEGVCRICQKPIAVDSRNTHVDHVETGAGPVVRGLLCGDCNKGLGHFRDSAELHRAAASYLEKWEAVIASGVAG